PANVGQPPISLTAPAANTWQQVTIPLSALGWAGRANFTGFVIQSSIGAAQPVFYLDDIQLNPQATPSVIHLNVDAAQTLRPADARWFGLNTAVWDNYFNSSYTSNAL